MYPSRPSGSNYITNTQTSLLKLLTSIIQSCSDVRAARTVSKTTLRFCRVPMTHLKPYLHICILLIHLFVFFSHSCLSFFCTATCDRNNLTHKHIHCVQSHAYISPRYTHTHLLKYSVCSAITLQFAARPMLCICSGKKVR